jgi:cation diffusion facilitator CzcD-associated flavoprotein CzcO
MTFDTEVKGCYWNEEKGQWTVKLKQQKEGEQPREFEETCDLLLNGTGILNNFKWPDIPGLKEKFKGRVVHTARWPKDYQKEQWAKDRVAVIGSGASSIQTVPTMQPHAKHLDVFVRTAVWFVQIANNFGQNKEYDDKERSDFRKDPGALVAHAKDIEDQINGLWGTFYKGSEAQKMGQEMFRNRMAEFIKDKRLLDGFTPTFGVGCRRVTPGDPYMLAIQEENVDVHFTPVVSCTEDGVVGEDGTERKVDTVICATGFDVSYRPRFPIVGKNGIDLADKWKICPESYLGLAVPDFPNMLLFIGPTWPVENGSVMGPLHSVSDYALQVIKKMQNENIRSWVPRQDIVSNLSTA